MERKTITVIALVLLAGLAGCVGGAEQADANNGDTELTSGEEYDTHTYQAAGTDKVWTCIEWEDYNGHKMECELVNSTEEY
ncbi:hypothetical protein M199_gp114 [Halogranum tailed virus 1]|uniref:Uncharacterized protein n=1 Tax=Halogranum tailed virus 1 TaxID=1273749 RepID=R4TLI1_9CAUD|nr:hypothetical protein M199_gp114 [Halogranum tailed virus 1]AGM11552.1 hypothetical protein HGTV1_255 [Halogranum tailed virus 1]